MGTIYQPTQAKFRVLQSEKTAYPTLRFAPAGADPHAIKQGTFVGVTPNAGGNEVYKAIGGDSDAIAQSKNALLRLNNTTNDVDESGAITCLEGFFRLETSLYLTSGSYAVGDFLALRYQAADGGVLGPVRGGTDTHAIAQVIVPPFDSATNTPMTVKVFPQPQKL